MYHSAPVPQARGDQTLMPFRKEWPQFVLKAVAAFATLASEESGGQPEGSGQGQWERGCLVPVYCGWLYPVASDS